MRQPAGGGPVREEILRRGWHLAIISTGALADSALEQRLLAAGGKLTLLSGAVAGIDGLAAAKEGGLERVTYQSRKARPAGAAAMPSSLSI